MGRPPSARVVTPFQDKVFGIDTIGTESSNEDSPGSGRLPELEPPAPSQVRVRRGTFLVRGWG